MSRMMGATVEDEDRPVSLQAPAPERDPLAGARLVSAMIGCELRAAMQAHQELETALVIGDQIKINAVLLALRRGAQSAHVLAFSLHKDVTAKLRREPRVRS